MVIHDETRVQAWTQKQTKPRRSARLSVWAVQSVACCVVLLVVLLLRVAGREAYASLRQRFQQALARNEWATALTLLWDDNPLEVGEAAEGNGVNASSFTPEETEQSVGSTATLPLDGHA